MATKRWLVNASPLILLGKSEHLVLLSLLADVVLVPQAVAHEIGTLGIIGRAKSEGLIKRAGPIIERLREAGLYISEDLVQRLLREVGE